MTIAKAAALPLLALALVACDSQAERQADATEDRIEQQADASAAASGAEMAALGLTERQLLDADLVAADGVELGDIEQIRRDASGADETGYLAPLLEIAGSGRTPADVKLDLFAGAWGGRVDPVFEAFAY